MATTHLSFESAKTSWLREPTYRWADDDGKPHLPTPREVLREWLDAINVIENPYRAPALLFAVFHLLTGLLFALSLYYLTLPARLWAFATALVVSLIYQTTWYHKYCSHGAFRFSNPWPARVYLWTNPLVMKEDVYAIAHRVHHQRADAAGDPHGPHLGWLGSYLCWESFFKTNPDISERQYETLTRSLRHLGIPLNTLADYRRTGSIEPLWHYSLRVLVAQAVFVAINYAIGGTPFVLAAYSGVFGYTFFWREFPWRSHGGNSPVNKIAGWEFDRRTKSTNRRAPGFLAGEWHDNHHRLPTSANCAVLPGQVDPAFLYIRALHALRIVRSYYDAATPFRAKLATKGQGTGALPAVAEDEDVFLEK
jgi:fatty-acid desaturase